MSNEPPLDSEGLANLPALTERELRVLLSCVQMRLRPPPGVEIIGDHSDTGQILWSLCTAVSEAISAAQLDAQRRSADDD